MSFITAETKLFFKESLFDFAATSEIQGKMVNNKIIQKFFHLDNSKSNCEYRKGDVLLQSLPVLQMIDVCSEEQCRPSFML